MFKYVCLNCVEQNGVMIETDKHIFVDITCPFCGAVLIATDNQDDKMEYEEDDEEIY